MKALSGNCIIYHQKFIIYIEIPESDSVMLFDFRALNLSSHLPRNSIF